MLVFMDETKKILHLVIDDSHFLLHLVMNNDYLGYIKILIHLFIPLEKLLSSTKERCKDRTFFIYVENLLTFGGFPRFYHENCQSTPKALPSKFQ